MTKITTEHLLGQLDRVKPHLVFDDYDAIKSRLLLMDEWQRKANDALGWVAGGAREPISLDGPRSIELIREIANADKGGE